MTRKEFIEILDGTHPTRGNFWAFAHQGIIMLAAMAIAIETVPTIHPWVRIALEAFGIFVLVLFSVEYIARVICAEHRWRYIFSFWGIVDLLSCLPILLVFQSHWAALRATRLIRLVWILKLLHTNHALKRLEVALYASRSELAVFAVLALMILYIAGVGIYIFEHEVQPEKFSSIPMSLWWAVVSFTTVGYGDMFPVTPGGRIFTSVILFVGLGVIAVPTAIITSALIHSNLTEQVEKDIEKDVGEEIREEVEKDLRQELHARKNQPKRR